MSVTLRLADDDAKVIADVLKASATIVASEIDIFPDAVAIDKAHHQKHDDLIALLDAACKVPGSWGSEYPKYQAGAERLQRISAAFATALKANVSERPGRQR